MSKQFMTQQSKSKESQVDQSQVRQSQAQHSDSSESAPKIVVMLHWLLVASVLYLFVSSWWMLSLPLPSDEFTYRVIPFQLHKNIGITLLLCIMIMVGLRIRRHDREQQAARSKLQKLADLDHLLIYGLLAACCISGYLSSSYSGWETYFWWFLSLPVWATENDELNILFSDIHIWACWALLMVISMHIAAALYHSFNDIGVIRKMFRLD
jgi:cytochrome b561